MIHSILLSVLVLLSPMGRTEPVDLVETASAAGKFQTLLAAAEKAGLVDTLRTADGLTILAPTDEAFSKVPSKLLQSLLLPENQESLRALLRHHVFAGRRSAAELIGAKQGVTLQGSTIVFTLDDGRLRAGEAQVLQNDVSASNGVIHVIDQVLVPKDFSLPKQSDSAVDLIEFAVSRGVPLYNDGNPAACASIYEVTIRALILLSLDSLGDRGVEALRNSLEVASHQSPTEQAWTLRRAIDAAWIVLETEANATARVDSDPWRSVFEFNLSESGDSPAWFSVNDNVMGGISEGGFEQATDTTAAFQGALSLDNNGGFSTIRSTARDLMLSGYSGLTIRVRGDGRTYSLSALKNDRRGEVRTWRTSFATVAGEWEEIRIPFSELELSVMGRQLPGLTIDPDDIRSLSFSISDKNEANFRLEIDWVRAYRESELSF